MTLETKCTLHDSFDVSVVVVKVNSYCDANKFYNNSGGGGIVVVTAAVIVERERHIAYRMESNKGKHILRNLSVFLSTS